MPNLMKYSPLPCERPEIVTPLNPPAEQEYGVSFRNSGRDSGEGGQGLDVKRVPLKTEVEEL
ncbi:hypothetical protein Bca4012_018725 [Brassica carinata]